MVDSFYARLYDNTVASIDETTGWFAIEMPFADLNNDNVEIYVRHKDGKIFLSDDGVTLQGLDLSDEDNQNVDLVKRICRSYDVSIEEGELKGEAEVSDFPERMCALLSAIHGIIQIRRFCV